MIYRALLVVGAIFAGLVQTSIASKNSEPLCVDLAARLGNPYVIGRGDYAGVNWLEEYNRAKESNRFIGGVFALANLALAHTQDLSLLKQEVKLLRRLREVYEFHTQTDLGSSDVSKGTNTLGHRVSGFVRFKRRVASLFKDLFWTAAPPLFRLLPQIVSERNGVVQSGSLEGEWVSSPALSSIHSKLNSKHGRKKMGIEVKDEFFESVLGYLADPGRFYYRYKDRLRGTIRRPLVASMVLSIMLHMMASQVTRGKVPARAYTVDRYLSDLYQHASINETSRVGIVIDEGLLIGSEVGRSFLEKNRYDDPTQGEKGLAKIKRDQTRVVNSSYEVLNAIRALRFHTDVIYIVFEGTPSQTDLGFSGSMEADMSVLAKCDFNNKDLVFVACSPGYPNMKASGDRSPARWIRIAKATNAKRAFMPSESVRMEFIPSWGMAEGQLADSFLSGGVSGFFHWFGITHATTVISAKAAYDYNKARVPKNIFVLEQGQDTPKLLLDSSE